MSMSYWICEGVGIRANQLRPFLNTQKCIQLLKEQLPGEEISEDGFDIDAYLFSVCYAAGFLCRCGALPQPEWN